MAEQDVLIVDTAYCVLPLMKVFGGDNRPPRLCSIPKLQMLVADFLVVNSSRAPLEKLSVSSKGQYCYSQRIYGFLIARAMYYRNKNVLKILLPTLRKKGLSFMWNPMTEGISWAYSGINNVDMLILVFTELATESKLPNLRVIDASQVMDRISLNYKFIESLSGFGLTLNSTSCCDSANPESSYIVKFSRSLDIPQTSHYEFYVGDKKMIISFECGVIVGNLSECFLQNNGTYSAQYHIKEREVFSVNPSNIPRFKSYNVRDVYLDSFDSPDIDIGRFLSKFPPCLTSLSLIYVKLDLVDLETLCSLEFTGKLRYVILKIVGPDNSQLRNRFFEKLSELIKNLTSVEVLSIDSRSLLLESNEEELCTRQIFSSILCCKNLTVLHLYWNDVRDRNVLLGASQFGSLPRLSYLKMVVHPVHKEVINILEEMFYNVKIEHLLVDGNICRSSKLSITVDRAAAVFIN